MSPQHTHINPSSLKAHFARRFLRALKNLKKNNHKSITNTTNYSRTLSTRGFYQRSHQIKIAANESMARAVGSRRAWSRAIILQMIRNRSRNTKGLVRKKRIIISSRQSLIRKRRKIGEGRRKERNRSPNPKKDHIQEEFGAELRKLVPGGEEMDNCKLLDETAHYVKCLTTQVEVMRRIVTFFST